MKIGQILFSFLLALPLAVSLGGVRPGQAASLAELGFVNGLSLHGPRGSADVFFPVGDITGTPQLVVDFAASTRLDALSSLTVEVEGEPLATLPAGVAGPVRIAVPRRLVHSGFLAVRFAADQALRRNNVCFDNDTPAVWTRIGPSTRLEGVGPGGSGIGAFWQGLSGRVAIALPDAADPAAAETALTLAVALLRRGAQPVGVPAETPGAALRIASGANIPSIELIPPASADAAPVLQLTTPDAARALVSASSALASARQAEGSGSPQSAPLAVSDSVSFAELGLHPSPVSISGTSDLRFSLPFDRLPGGLHPRALQLFGRSDALPPNETLVTSLSLITATGPQLIWSRTWSGVAELDGEEVPIPPAMLHQNLTVLLRLVRLGGQHTCGGVDALNFQLRDTSRLLLANGASTVRHFGDFAAWRDTPTLVRLDTPPEAFARSLPLIAQLLASAGTPPWGVRVVGNETGLDKPFLLVSDRLPTAIAAPLRPEHGVITLSLPRLGVRTTLSGFDEIGLLSVVHNAGGTPGLWLSPGRIAPPLRTNGLDTGDVAIFTADGLQPAVFDTTSPDTVIETPQRADLGALLQRWRAEIFVVAWAFITLLTVAIVVRLRRPSSRN